MEMRDDDCKSSARFPPKADIRVNCRDVETIQVKDCGLYTDIRCSWMSTFYFNLHNSDGWTRDQEGQDLHGTSEAIRQALKETRALIAADVIAGRPIVMSSFVAVNNQNGVEIGRVGFAKAFSFIS